MLDKLLVICLFTIPYTLIPMEASSYLAEETIAALTIPSGRSIEMEAAIQQATSKKQKNESTDQMYVPYGDVARGITPGYKWQQIKASNERAMLVGLVCTQNTSLSKKTSH